MSDFVRQFLLGGAIICPAVPVALRQMNLQIMRQSVDSTQWRRIFDMICPGRSIRDLMNAYLQSAEFQRIQGKYGTHQDDYHRQVVLNDSVKGRKYRVVV